MDCLRFASRVATSIGLPSKKRVAQKRLPEPFPDKFELLFCSGSEIKSRSKISPGIGYGRGIQRTGRDARSLKGCKLVIDLFLDCSFRR